MQFMFLYVIYVINFMIDDLAAFSSILLTLFITPYALYLLYAFTFFLFFAEYFDIDTTFFLFDRV
jgi:hypothetical protein